MIGGSQCVMMTVVIISLYIYRFRVAFSRIFFVGTPAQISKQFFTPTTHNVMAPNCDLFDQHCLLFKNEMERIPCIEFFAPLLFLLTLLRENF